MLETLVRGEESENRDATEGRSNFPLITGSGEIIQTVQGQDQPDWRGIDGLEEDYGGDFKASGCSKEEEKFVVYGAEHAVKEETVACVYLWEFCTDGSFISL